MITEDQVRQHALVQQDQGPEKTWFASLKFWDDRGKIGVYGEGTTAEEAYADLLHRISWIKPLGPHYMTRPSEENKA